GCLDPPPGVPRGDAVAHGYPVRHVARAGADPDLARIGFRDEGQEASLSLTDGSMLCVHGGHEGLGAAFDLHPGPHKRSRGESSIPEHMFGCQVREKGEMPHWRARTFGRSSRMVAAETGRTQVPARKRA